MLITLNSIVVYLVYTLVYAIFIFVMFITDILDSTFLFFKNENHSQLKFDYIIVGSGSAGSMLTSDLLKNNSKNHSILLIEAGPLSYEFLSTPSLSPLLQTSLIDWKYETVPQKYACWGLKNNASKWPRGKILGGSSRLNYMVYLKGHHTDLDTWPESWSFSDFKHFSVPHNVMKPWSLLSKAISSSMEYLGYHKTDLNTGMDVGYMNTPVTINDGIRSCCDNHIDQTDPLLTILTNALVTKILFEENVAKGVEYDYFNQKLKVYADTVILSAGAIGSPQLLMLSGIGPKDHLKEMNIPLLVDSPEVGSNLQDHIGVGMDSVEINETIISSYDIINMKHAYDFFSKREGLWTFGGVELVAMLKSKTSLKTPDIQLMFLPAGVSMDSGAVFRHSMGISDPAWSSYFKPVAHKSVVTCAIILLHPLSKGHIRLKDNSPYSKPVIDPMYFSKREDVLTLVRGIRFVQKLVKQEGFQSLNATYRLDKVHGCAHHLLDSGEYWECYIRSLSFTIYHPAGTCSIGKVVDENLRVKGVEGLYIADASVFPTLPSANTQALTILVAQKLSRILKYDRLVRSIPCDRKFTFLGKSCLSRTNS